MSEVRSALVWERGGVGVSPLTVTLQEAKVRKKHLVMALLCEGEEGGVCPQLPAGYLCESLVGWFYNELLPICKRSSECDAERLKILLLEQWERAAREWKEYAGKRACSEEVRIGGILLWDSFFVVFGNMPVYVLNRRFNRPRKKNLLSGTEIVTFYAGEVSGFISFYVENEAMRQGIKEEEVLESLYVETPMNEQRLEKRLTELGSVARERCPGKPIGAVALEVTS